MKHLFTFLFSFILLTGLAQVPVMSPITGPSVICSSSAITVSYTTSATNSPTSYSWTYTSSTSSATLGSNSNVGTAVFYDVNQTYTVYCTATNANGTSLTESFVVNVFETPNVSFSGSNTFCQGSSTNLSASSTILAASPTVSYNWAPAYGLNTTSGANVVASPTLSTTYTVTAINGVCSNTAQIVVAPFETMSVTFSGANTFCQGSSTNLSASSTILAASPTISYSWTPNIGLNTTFGPNVIANPATSTVYTVTATMGSCSNSGQITVGPNGFSLPNVTASSTHSAVCYGDTATLNGFGADSYTWNNGIQNGIAFNVYNSNTYYVTGTDINGCTGSASVSVNVDPLAYFSVNSTSNPLPSGQTATLTINGNAGTSYSLNTISTPTTIVVSPTVTTTYTFTSVNSSGCEYTEFYTLDVGTLLGVQAINNTVKDYFMIYPNPNNGVFQIKSSIKETIHIINQLGEIVRVVDLDPETEFQIADLSSGVYVIHSNRKTVKMIVTQ